MKREIEEARKRVELADAAAEALFEAYKKATALLLEAGTRIVELERELAELRAQRPTT